jgi:Uma2 family endonuclease
MSTAIESSPAQALPGHVPFDLTTDLFTRLVESDLLPRERRLFLRDGRLFEKISKTKAHGSVGASITMSLAPRLPTAWSLWPESTILLDPSNAPLPDYAVVRSGQLVGRSDPERYPGPTDIGLVIVLAVTSLRNDVTTALELYARTSIPTYWIVDVPGRCILVHSEPRVLDGRGEYAGLETYHGGQTIPLILDGQEVARVPFNDILR